MQQLLLNAKSISEHGTTDLAAATYNCTSEKNLKKNKSKLSKANEFN
jgi:hypothetical protein